MSSFTHHPAMYQTKKNRGQNPVRIVSITLLVLFACAVLFSGAACAYDNDNITTKDELKQLFKEGGYGKLGTPAKPDSFSDDFTISEGKNVVLDLNGQKIDYSDCHTSNPVITLKKNAHLTVYDNSTGEKGTIGYVKHDKSTKASAGILLSESGAEFTLNSGTITECQSYNRYGAAVELREGTKFIMNGGAITNSHSEGDNYGGAVGVSKNSNFTMNGGIIDNCRAEVSGGAVAIQDEGTFIMNNGMIRNCRVSHTHGGAVYITDKGTFTMINGTITNCYTQIKDGGCVFMEGESTFIMKGGTISECKSENDGGGVYVNGKSKFIMEGGEIKKCTAKRNGGGVYLNDNASFTMNNGTISGCTATDNGGGIYLEDKALLSVQNAIISGCTATNKCGGGIFSANKVEAVNLTISNCKAGTNGGGIYVADKNSKTAILSGTTITECTAKDGAGVYLEGTKISFTLDDSSITNCKASSRCGGFYGAPILSGKVIIIGNTNTNNNPQNVYVPDKTTLSVSKDLNADSKIGITTEKYPENGKPITFLNYPSDVSSCFRSDVDDVAIESNKASSSYDIQAIKISGSPAVKLTHSGTSKDYYQLFNAVSAAQNGDTLTLLTDVKDNAVFTENKGTITFNLDGHTLTARSATNPVITVNSGTDLIITGSGKITGSTGSGIYVKSGAEVTLQSGTITGNTAQYGGGINNAGTLIVTGGTITGNTASVSGGGIYSAGDLSVTGGKITGNAAPKGSGIYYGGKSFTLGGSPEISANIDTGGNENNVYLADPGTYRITIANGFAPSAKVGVTIAQAPPQTITNTADRDYSRYFVSNNADYDIEDDANSVVIVEPIPVVENRTVSFDTLGVGQPPASQVVENNTKATKPADPAEPGYRFNYWSSSISGTEGYDFNTPVTCDMTLYASWTKLWLVNFDMLGVGESPAGYPMQVDNGTVIPEPSPAPAADGYQFNGWYNSSDYANTFDFSKPITADTTIYAKWTKECIVSFDMNGYGSPAPAEQKVLAGGKATEPTPAPTQDGYIFDGWYNGISKFDFANTPITDHTRLHAQWTAIDYTVTFNSAGGTDVDTQYVHWGDLVAEPQNVTREDSILLGWYNEKELWNFASDKVYADLNLTAHWQYVDDRHRVSIADIENATGYISTDLAKEGETVKIAIKADDGSKVTDMNVKDIDGGSVTLNDVEKRDNDTVWISGFTMPNADVILNGCALYQKFTVTYEGNGGTVNPTSQIVAYGGYASEPAASKANCVLAGWKNDNADWNFGTDKVYADITLTAQWTDTSETLNTITVSPIDNGVIYASAKAAKAGDSINISIRAKEGSKITSFTVNGSPAENLTHYDHDVIWVASFIMPEDNVVISGTCVPTACRVTFDAAGGTVSPQSADISYGSTAFEPYAVKAHAVLTGWNNTTAPWNFAADKVYGPVTLTAQWVDIPVYYSITAEEIANGVIFTASKAAKQGDTISVTISADEDFEVSTLTYNGNPVSLTPSPDNRTMTGSFTMPASDVILSGTTTQVNFTVKAVIEDGADFGNFTVDKSKARTNEFVQFNATPYTGYAVKDNTVVINSEPKLLQFLGGSGIFDYKVGTVNVLGNVNFANNRFKITIDNPDASAKLITGTTVAGVDDTVKVVSVPGIGRNVSQFYYINSVTGERTNIAAQASPKELIFFANFTMPKADITVSAEYEERIDSSIHKINTPPSVTGGKILTPAKGKENKPVLILTVPEAGYWVEPATVKVTSVDTNANIPVTRLKDNIFTFTMPASDVYVSAQFSNIKPVPTERQYSGGSSDSGSGNYNYYPRTADGKGGVISFGTSKTVKSVDLPEGVTGEVTLVAKSSVPAPANYNTYNVFEINIPRYPTGKEAVVEFVVPMNTLAKEGKTPADVGLLHGDGANWDAGTLPTTFTVDSGNAVYHSTTTAFSPFAIVYVEGAATAETPEAAGAVVSEYDPAKDEGEVLPTAANTAMPTSVPAAATATQAAKSPLGITGMIAGIGVACVLIRRRA